MLRRYAYSTALLSIPLLFCLNACTTAVQSNPPRTATEELLISTAADHAARKLTLDVPPHAKVFLDTGNFEGTDSKNAVAAIRTALLSQGFKLADDKKSADIVAEARAGALSIDRSTFLIGIPSFAFPVPFASSALTFPQIALYGTEDQDGIAKFALTGYDARQGSLVSAQEPQYGFSHNTKTTVLIFVSWSESDAIPEEDKEQSDHQPEAKDQETPHPEMPLSGGASIGK